MFLKRRSSGGCANVQERKNSHENLFETLEVPVLVDDSVDDSGKEDLLSLVCEEVHKVMHLVDSL